MRASRTKWLSTSRARSGRLLLAAVCLVALANADIVDAEPRARRGGTADEPWPLDADAQTLLDKTLSNLYHGDFVQVVRLESRRGSGRSMTRRLQVVRKESELPGRAVLRFLSPDDVRGSSMLVIEREEQPDDVFLFLPAAARTRRISLAQRYDSFFGTNLTYEDLEPKEEADFEARIEGLGEVEGIRCVNLQIRPRAGVKSQYDFTRACIDPERPVALRTEYFVAGRLIKRLEVDPRRIEFLDGRYVPEYARLESIATDFTTEITTELYERKESIPDRLFSTWNLETGSDTNDLHVLRSVGEEAR